MGRIRPLVTFVISNYNYAQYVSECLDACVRQKWAGEAIACVADVEVVVVDDASTDNSSVVLDAYARDWPCVQLLRHEQNQGYSAAKNTAIEWSIKRHPNEKNHFFVHIDADDKPTEDGVERRLRYFLRKPRFDVVHGMALRWYGANDVRGFNPNRYPHAQGVMIRREVYEQYGLYYEHLRSKADKEYWYRIGMHPESPLPKRVRDKQIKVPVAYYRKHKLQMHKIRKYKCPEINLLVEELFARRIARLKKEGITRENTKFLS